MNVWNKAISSLLEEVYTAEYWESTWFKDNEPGSSMLPTLDQLSAKQASTAPACGRNTIAAHARHALAWIEMSIGFARGEEPKVDWEGTWAVQQVSEGEWAALRTELRRAANDWRAIVEQNEEWDEDRCGGAVASVAHGAYHLGAIRQLASEYVKHR